MRAGQKRLKALENKFPHRLVEVNIDSEPALKEKYGNQIPVVEIGPYKLKAPITSQTLEMTLGAAGDRRGQLEQVDGEKFQQRVHNGETVSKSDRLYFWISRIIWRLSIGSFLFMSVCPSWLPF